jgi:hypothetical protein
MVSCGAKYGVFLLGHILGLFSSCPILRPYIVGQVISLHLSSNGANTHSHILCTSRGGMLLLPSMTLQVCIVCFVVFTGLRNSLFLQGVIACSSSSAASINQSSRDGDDDLQPAFAIRGVLWIWRLES